MRLGHIELTELEGLLLNSHRHPSEQQAELRGVQEHLQQCTECAELAEAYMFLGQKRPPLDNLSPGDCPSDEKWLEMAAGLLQQDEVSELLTHATSCSSCANQLRGATEDVGTSTLDEGLASLNSSTPEWQDSLADRLSAMNDPEQRIKIVPLSRRLPRWQSTIWVGIAAALFITVTTLGLRQYWPRSEDTLLTSAYNQQRRTLLRLSGGDPVPLASPTRGGSDIATSVDLLKLKLRAQEHLDKDPNDAYWQQVLGRVALVEGDGDAAHRKFEIARALNPVLPGLKFDLAAAYFERGEASAALPNMPRQPNSMERQSPIHPK